MSFQQDIALVMQTPGPLTAMLLNLPREPFPTRGPYPPGSREAQWYAQVVAYERYFAQDTSDNVSDEDWETRRGQYIRFYALCLESQHTTWVHPPREEQELWIEAADLFHDQFIQEWDVGEPTTDEQQDAVMEMAADALCNKLARTPTELGAPAA